MAGNTNMPSPAPAQVGSPTVGPAPLNPQGQGTIPFRIATLERGDVIGTTQIQPGAAESISDNPLPGTGYMYEIDLNCNAPASGNSVTTIASTEDAPYIAVSSVILGDVTGQIVNLDGWSLKQIGKYGGWEPFNEEGSADTANVFQFSTATGGAGGTFEFHLKVPVGINRRDLVAILGNQDRSQQYTLRHNVNASANIYATAPSTVPTLTITRNYGSYAVPNASNEQGQPNQVVPNTYGVISYLTKTIADAPPVPSSQVTHFIRRVGNALRVVMLVFRAGTGATPRSVAEGAMPTNIQFKVGDQIIFNEATARRRIQMWDRYGFDPPKGQYTTGGTNSFPTTGGGVLVYDNIHDSWQFAGSEFYHDWLWTEAVVQAQFLITYPSGFTAGGSLTFVTSDVIVPPGTPLYSPI